MEQKGMTARICAYSRAYHREHNKVRIFDDVIAKRILSEEEYETISKNMANGILYFNQGFQGSKEEALRWIVDHQLSQTPLARAAFAEKALEDAVVGGGAEQYLICAAGYDTFSYRQPEWAKKLCIFEIDYPTTSEDKQERLKRGKIFIPNNVHFVKADFSKHDWVDTLKESADFDSNRISFCSFLGVIYYLKKDDFEQFIKRISEVVPKGSSIVFDYPNEHYFDKQKKHSELAKASNEAMQACYSYEEMEVCLKKYGFVIRTHLNADQMTSQFFWDYNKANDRYKMKAQENVNYCLTMKKY